MTLMDKTIKMLKKAEDCNDLRKKYLLIKKIDCLLKKSDSLKIKTFFIK